MEPKTKPSSFPWIPLNVPMGSPRGPFWEPCGYKSPYHSIEEAAWLLLVPSACVFRSWNLAWRRTLHEISEHESSNSRLVSLLVPTGDHKAESCHTSQKRISHGTDLHVMLA